MINKESEKLKFFDKEGLTLYNAGLPHFKKNFTRDSIISSLLNKNMGMLKNQLIYSARNQGQVKNNFNGEEIGKIHHEIPEFINKNFSTKYNACDTTALFLIGHEVYLKETGDDSLFKSQRENLILAVNYILRHIQNGFFIEDPSFSDADSYLLKVTYWKDSELIGREEGIPRYPITYTLAHVQNMRALRSAYFLFKEKIFKKIYNEMAVRLRKTLYDKKRQKFCLAIDKLGKIFADSSDFLHMLFYLEKKELNKRQINSILKLSKSLETEAGYLALSEKDSEKLKDKYHGKIVWSFEQAIINGGAKRFGMKEIENVSKRIISFLDTAPELICFEGKKIVKKGCDPQLWTIAAKEYFLKLS